MPSETAPREDLPGLSNSRADFAASLQRRIETVLAALSDFEAQPASPDRRDNFLRRIHALRASAKVLGFAAASEVLSYAEQQIRTCSSESPNDDVAAVKKQLESLPSLVLRGAHSLAPPSPPSARPKSIAPLLSEPLAVLVWGTPDFVETLRSIERGTPCLELSVVERPDDLRSTCAAIGPDVLVLDANLGSITLLVDELAQAPETSAIPIVVANVPDAATAGLQELGARLVLPSRASEHQLSHALFQVRHPVPERTVTPAPLGDVTLKDLAERLAQEIRLGLVDSAPAAAQLESIPLAEGTAIRAALWAALAQIREQVADASAGRVQFTSGPEGSTPIAPRSAPSARPRTSVSADAVDLTGRRMLVVDDDPAVAWFVGGTLRAAGALVTELHDGADALELAYRAWPELIVSDVLMPGLDGFALCHAIKRDVLLRDVPIVLLSWKEDLLFRLRELGADADGYLRKEANASTIVRRVRELLLPRSALERRLAVDRESRGRLDGMSTRLLLELAVALERPLRIALRDSTALYDIRVRHGTLATVTRARHDGTVDQGEAVLAPLLGVTAARFSVVTDREACDPMFFGSLADILQPSASRTRAAQRLLSGTTLGTIERVGIAPEAFGGELPPLPLSLRPIADELLRGASPRQLLASGVASAQLLESLLSDLARRGSIRSIQDVKGQDLLESEIQRLNAKPAILPPKPASRPQPQFTFQLSPAPPDVVSAGEDQADANPRAREPSLDVTASAMSHASTRTPEPAASVAPSALEPPPNALAALTYLGAAAADAPKLSVPPEPQQHQSSETHRHATQGSPEHAKLAADVPPVEADLGLDARVTIPANSPSLSGSLAGTSLLPQQLTVTSNPPPSDDFDWAAELTWDTTPPPATAPASDVSSLTAFEKTGSIIDDPTRPDVPRLDRLVQHIPGAAEALARGAFETTPTAQLPRKQLEQAARAAMGVSGEAMRQASPSPRLFADLKHGKLDDASDALNLTNRKPSSAVEVTPPPAITPPGTPPTPGDSPLSPVVASPIAAKAAELHPQLATPPQAHGIAPATPATDATRREFAAETSGGGTLRVLRAATPVRFIDAPPLHQDIHPGESPAALPVVHQPPRPRSDDRSKADDKARPDDHPSQDPIFPLVSAPTPQGVDIQPSIEIGPTETGQATARAPSIGEPLHPQARDTLRSPSDQESQSRLAQDPNAAPSRLTPQEDADAIAPVRPDEPNEPTSPDEPIAPGSASTRVAVAAAAESDKTLFSPSESDAAPRSIPSRSAPPSPIPPDHQRQVGWMQAVGLATLAGIVTFAATVPIASWFHRHQQPLRTEPPVAAEALPTAPTPSADDLSTVPVSAVSTATVLNAAESSNSRPAPSASIEEITVPNNVTLRPGEAVIEVMTGGDHAIFLDDTFVGRGPLRIIPVANGRHVVRTRLNGAERSDSVEVGTGRALRLSLEQAWK